MANTAEIRDTHKTNYSAVLSIKDCGGDIDSVIRYFKGLMHPEDESDVAKAFQKETSK